MSMELWGFVLVAVLVAALAYAVGHSRGEDAICHAAARELRLDDERGAALRQDLGLTKAAGIYKPCGWDKINEP